MEQKLEKALIRTYRKLKESPNVKGSELIGLFINFYYSESNFHSGLFSNDFYAMRDSNLDIEIIYCGTSHYRTPLYTQLQADMKDLKTSDYYALWLRASWESPKDEYYGDPIVRGLPSIQSILSQGIADGEYKGC